MDWRAIKQGWSAYRHEARRAWPELDDGELERVNGDRTELIKKLREHYGWQQEEATLEADRWADALTGSAEVAPSVQG